MFAKIGSGLNRNAKKYRKKAVDVLRQLKEMDAFIMNGFKEILASS